jgi:hypothetical protein
VIALIATALAQQYAFPTSAPDYGTFYPTAYKDQGGVDWNCGGIMYAGHDGSDFGVGGFPGMDEGRDIVAAAAGVVSATNDGEFDRCTTGDCYGGGGFGNYVYIDHPDGKTTIYAHMKQWTVAVAPGQSVSCGQYLGLVGSSGYSTGPHIHFQVDEPGFSGSDPFDGPCGFPPTYWVSQGPYGGLPGNTCEDAPECVPWATLSCGEVRTGLNADAGVQATSFYGCSDYVYSGPEVVFTLTTSSTETVSLTLTGLSGDLDMFALSSTACDGSGCLAGSTNPYAQDESLSYAATAGVPTTIVIDGWEGAVSNYTLSVGCTAPAPPPPTGTGTGSGGTAGGTGTTAGTPPPGETGLPADTDEPSDDVGESVLPTASPRRPLPGGCATAPVGAGFAALLLTPWRRRRPSAGGSLRAPTGRPPA